MNLATIPALVAGSEKNHDGVLYYPKRYVRKVKDEELKDFFGKKGRVFIEKKYGSVDVEQRHRLIFLLRLGRALTKKDAKAINKAIEAYLDSSISIDSYEAAKEYYSQEESWAGAIERQPRETVTSLMKEWLGKTHLVTWWPKNDNRIHMGFF